MRRIGFRGGSSIYELGTSSDMVFFFSTIKKQFNMSKDELFQVDRLYRNYVRMEDLDMIKGVMLNACNYLSKLSIDYSVVEDLGLDIKDITFDFEKRNISDVFSKYFESLFNCISISRKFYDKFLSYKPVIVVITDMPRYIIDTERPLEEYDKLGPDDTPFWLR